ncbi:MAG: nucleoside-diphosphate kinase, partial [Acidobacteriaceae bacterium]|nr:nucleoside-diphosphate kinase [Acidobacteriaceae bacterium]
MAFERTFAMIKPDAVANRHVGEIIAFIEENGFQIVGMKIQRIARHEADAFYAVHRERPFFKGLVEFMTEGPVVVMVLQR